MPRRWQGSRCRSGCRRRRRTCRPEPGRSKPCLFRIVASAIGVLTTGASLTGSMVSLKVSEALSEPSLAVTFRSRDR